MNLEEIAHKIEIKRVYDAVYDGDDKKENKFYTKRFKLIAEAIRKDKLYDTTVTKIINFINSNNEFYFYINCNSSSARAPITALLDVLLIDYNASWKMKYNEYPKEKIRIQTCNDAYDWTDYDEYHEFYKTEYVKEGSYIIHSPIYNNRCSKYIRENKINSMVLNIDEKDLKLLLPPFNTKFVDNYKKKINNKQRYHKKMLRKLPIPKSIDGVLKSFIANNFIYKKIE